MLNFPGFDPIAVRIGPLAIHWYGLMYLLAFIAGYLLSEPLARRRGLDLSGDRVADMVLYVLGGVILGGRLGYCLFYNPSYYLSHPLSIPAVWQGGMSFHGGLIGVIVAALLFCRRFHYSPLALGDVLATVAPIGLGLGRIGNFINGELWGRPTQVPWAMVFPAAGPEPRHPSQLYEASLEGVVLFIILWFLCRPSVARGVPLFAFAFFYGIFRFGVEFFRQPDAQLGFLWGGATMGQLLSLPMIVIGATGAIWAWRRGRG